MCNAIMKDEAVNEQDSGRAPLNKTASPGASCQRLLALKQGQRLAAIAPSLPPLTQKGAVLVIGLLILLGMTQLAVTGMTTSITQETIARNTHDLVQTLNATESIANYAFAQDDWVSLAINLVTNTNPDLWKNYAFADADIVGQEVVDRYDMSVELRTRKKHPVGSDVDDGATLNPIQLSIQASAKAKGDDGVTNTTTHGWQRMVAAGS